MPFFKLMYLQSVSVITWWLFIDNYKTSVMVI